jgi:hypothetical protein
MAIERIPIVSRDQWLELRRHDICASDVPAVCGDALFGSAAQVWAEKRGLIPAKAMTEPMKRGLWLEPAVLEAIRWYHPDWDLRRAKVYVRDGEARLGCTPDFACVRPDRQGIGTIQAKVISRPVFNEHWRARDNDTIIIPPLAYQLQTLTEAMLNDAPWCMLAALVIDTFTAELFMVDVPRHPEAEARIRSKVEWFWKAHLDPAIQPKIDPERDGDLIKTLFPRDSGATVDLSGDNMIMNLVEKLNEFKSEIKTREEAKENIETEIKAKLGDATYGKLRDGREISYKLQVRKGYEVKPAEYRVLRVPK